MRVAVVGQIGQDLVLVVDEVPGAGGSTPVRARRELLGGKGANQGVGCRRLGADVALVGVVGDDEPGRSVLGRATGDGMDVSAVVRRQGTTTALLVDVVDAEGHRRLLEHVPAATLLTSEDVTAAEPVLSTADAVLLQLQQPADALLTALELVREDALVVADGAPPDDRTRQALLARADVVRADDTEAEMLLGRDLADVEATARAARDLVASGPRVVVLAADGGTNVIAWGDEHRVIPAVRGRERDRTGAGDAYVAALVTALLEGRPPEVAGWWGAAAASLVVAHPGGRPDFDRATVAEAAERARAEARR